MMLGALLKSSGEQGKGLFLLSFFLIDSRAYCRCRVFMVTGDYQLTGVAIAKQVRGLGHFYFSFLTLRVRLVFSPMSASTLSRRCVIRRLRLLTRPAS